MLRFGNTKKQFFYFIFFKNFHQSERYFFHCPFYLLFTFSNFSPPFKKKLRLATIANQLQFYCSETRIVILLQYLFPICLRIFVVQSLEFLWFTAFDSVRLLIFFFFNSFLYIMFSCNKTLQCVLLKMRNYLT